MTTKCPTRLYHVSHDMDSIVDVLQVSSDGGASFYQVKVNEIPDSELYMELCDSGYSAIVTLKRKGNRISFVRIHTIGDLWVTEAHYKVEKMLREYYKFPFMLRWSTKQGGFSHDA